MRSIFSTSSGVSTPANVEARVRLLDSAAQPLTRTLCVTLGHLRLAPDGLRQ